MTPTEPTTATTGDLDTRMAHIMSIINGTGRDTQPDTWNDMTSTASQPTVAQAVGDPAHVQSGPVDHAAPATTGAKAQYQSYAASRLNAYGWDQEQLQPLIDLWTRESGWNPNAQNKTSSAYGIAQFLDSTWGSYGKKTADPNGQIDAGLAYIKARYGSPQAALTFWLARHPINGKDVGNWY